MEVKQLNGDGQGTHTWVGGPLAIRPLPPLRKGVESREAWVDTPGTSRQAFPAFLGLPPAAQASAHNI